MSLFRNICMISLAAQGALSALADRDALEKRIDTSDMDACNNGPGGGWAPVTVIGGKDNCCTGDGSGGQKACETQAQSGGDWTPITQIEVWTHGGDRSDRIAGLQFTYGSGALSQMYGDEDTASVPSNTLKMAPGETIKGCTLYGNGKGEWLGHIHIETNLQTWDAGKQLDSSSNDNTIQTGGGILLGATVTVDKDGNGNSIRNLAFLFLGAEIDHLSIDNISFTNDPDGSNTGIDPQSIDVGEWFNHANIASGYNYVPTFVVSSSYSYSQTSMMSFGAAISVEMSAEILGIGAKEDDSFTWSSSQESATTSATSSATSVACAATGAVPPHSGIKVTGSYQTGNGEWDYTSQVTVNLKGGGTYSYQENGKFTNTAYTNCHTTIDQVNDTSIKNTNALTGPGSKMRRGILPTPAPKLPLRF